MACACRVSLQADHDSGESAWRAGSRPNAMPVSIETVSREGEGAQIERAVERARRERHLLLESCEKRHESRRDEHARGAARNESSRPSVSN
jgi:hypothetical protein